MSSIAGKTRQTGFLLALLLQNTAASPIHFHLSKRTMSTGARAGMGIGIAVAALFVVGVIIFFIVHFRRRAHLAALNRERAILAGEKNKDGSDKTDKFAAQPAEAPSSTSRGMPRRNKSVKDRLMGPLYRGSTIDLMPVPRAHKTGERENRQSTMTVEGHNWESVDGQPLVHKPWNQGESSPRPSFSSKRATRMMMMM